MVISMSDVVVDFLVCYSCVNRCKDAAAQIQVLALDGARVFNCKDTLISLCYCHPDS